MKYVYFYKTDMGEIAVAEHGQGITDIYFTDSRCTNSDNHFERCKRLGVQDVTVMETPIIEQAAKQLFEYFAGERKQFDIQLDLQGTEFQKKVWNALMEIPYGRTYSYGEIAAAIGQPKASRAVGMANNRNPVCIIVPCHRVIGSNGKLVGYAGGLHVKEYLLQLEKQ